jgi:hypothetical protein
MAERMDATMAGLKVEHLVCLKVELMDVMWAVYLVVWKAGQ